MTATRCKVSDAGADAPVGCGELDIRLPSAPAMLSATTGSLSLSSFPSERQRMAVRLKDRFEVFKRDAFTCQYCGRRVPDVVLEVDHIIPRAEGGGDEIENLVTSCWECNRGKGKRLLDERAPVADIEERTAMIQERERQLRAYNNAKAVELDRKDADFTRVWNYWFDLWDTESMSRSATPWKNTLKNAIEHFGAVEVMGAMDIVRDKFQYPGSAPAKYFGGILRKKEAERG
jgi:hypothetical protein